MIPIIGKDLIQWEKNREIDLKGIDDIDRLDWSNPLIHEAIPTYPEAGAETALIPNELLQSSAAITVHAVMDDKVVDMGVFEVKARKQPADYIYEPSEIESFKTLVDKMSDLEDKINSSGGGGGTTNYEELNNLPSINGVELKGKLPLNALGIAGRDEVEAAFNSLYNDALPKGYVAKSSIIDELDNALGEVTEHEVLDVVSTFYQVLQTSNDIEGVKSQISEAQESVDSVKYDYVSQARLFDYSNSSENLLNEGGYENYGYRWEQNNNNELVVVDDIKYSMLHDIPLPDGTKKIYVYNSNIKTDIGDEFSIFFTPSTYKVLGSAKLTGNYNGAEIDVPDGATRFHVDIKNTYLNPFSTVKVYTNPIDTIKERYLPSNVATTSYVDDKIGDLNTILSTLTDVEVNANE